MHSPLVSRLLFWRAWVSVIAPLALAAIPLTASSQNEKAMWVLYTILVCAVYWVFECAPLAITSLLPVVILPLAGVISTDSVCRNYLKGTNMMFLAGLIMAIAVEHSGLHSRVAMNMIHAIGTSKRRLMLGFMMCAMFLSMWISNTAATAMMVPIVDAICAAINTDPDTELEDKNRTKDSDVEAGRSKGSKYRNYLLLSVAYAANIGGTGVITGSPPNLVVLSSINDMFGEQNKSPLTYASWMGFVIPLMLVNTFLAWVLLISFEAIHSRNEQKPTKEEEKQVQKVLDHKRKQLGSMTPHEIQVLVLFIILVLLWFFQRPKFMNGWADLKELGEVSVASATPAVLVVWLLFLLPKVPSLSVSSKEALLDWKTVEKRLPWGVILLLGGGFALADATSKSGLSTYLSAQLRGLESLGRWQVNLIISAIVTFVTEVASNTATANIVVPILNEISVSVCYNPIYMMLTSALCCSYAFMLPVATAPNAIVFMHSTMKTSDMMKTGFLLNIICILTTNTAINTWGDFLFGLDEYPAWAASAAQDCNVTSFVTAQNVVFPTNITQSLPSPISG